MQVWRAASDTPALIDSLCKAMAVLVHQLQPKLNNAGQVALRVHRTELRIPETGVGRREARAVRDVEHFRTELEIEPFLQLGIFGERHIDLLRPLAPAAVE